MSPETSSKPAAVRYYRKRVELFRLIDKIRLWPSRHGILHGIKTIEVLGSAARLTTHCGRTFLASNSRNSRAARWLRNKWFKRPCAACGVPDWKLEKYGFFAIINTPSVFPELLNPVLSFNITSSKPVELTIARKSFPGIAPPSHLYQLSTMPFFVRNGSPTKTWSATINRPPGCRIL